MTPIELTRWQAQRRNLEPGSLTGYDCPKCRNRGYFFHVDELGRSYTEECGCMAVRRSFQRIRRSGLADMLTRCTMDTWQEREPWQRRARELAVAYAEHPEGWFLAAGRPGTGKTHLCTAICGMLMEGGVDVHYALWRDMSVRAKAVTGTDSAEYQRIVEPLKRVQCLYLDDLFKTKAGDRPTTGDINLAFEILNSRYNDTRLLTIISTEYTAEQLTAIDEATGSRIYQRSKRYYLSLAGKENWRLR